MLRSRWLTGALLLHVNLSSTEVLGPVQQVRQAERIARCMTQGTHAVAAAAARWPLPKCYLNG